MPNVLSFCSIEIKHLRPYVLVECYILYESEQRNLNMESDGKDEMCRRGLCLCPCRLRRSLVLRTILLVAALSILIRMSVVFTFVEDRTNRIYPYKFIKEKKETDNILERQKERKTMLQSACKSLNITLQPDNPHKKCGQTYIDQNRKFIYCLINKVSSSSMKKALVNGTGLRKFQDVQEMKINDPMFLRKFGLQGTCVPKSKANKHINDYFKFIIVRHPLKRLLSSYRDKFLGKHKDNINTFQKGIGTKIIRKYRKNPSHESLANGHDVTLEEFLRHVIDSKDHPDNHWNTYWSSCHPCENSFDFIAYMETIEDISYILKKVSKRPVPLPENNRKLVAPGKTDEVFQESYRNIPEWIMKAIIKQFDKDFKVFGYDPYIYKPISDRSAH